MDSQPCFQTVRLPNTEGDLVVAKLPEIVQHVCARAPSFADSFVATLGEETRPELHGILYTDEVIGGNILSVQKKKKCNMFYLGFRHMLDFSVREDAWLSVAAVQTYALQEAGAPLSVVAAVLVRTLYESAQQGFDLTHKGRTWRCSLAPQLQFIADGEAIRSVYGFNGAAAIRCCWVCSNVVSKRMRDLPAGFVNIAEVDATLFVPATDKELFDAAAAMRGLSRARRAAFAKSSGVKHIPDGLLADPVGRTRMPPSAALFDSTHLYFSNGLVSWEMALSLAKFRECVPGFTLDAIRETVGQSVWRKQGRNTPCTDRMRAWFTDKFWSEEQFKGMARETHSAFAVYYRAAVSVLDGVEGAQPALTSLSALWLVCRELRSLYYRPRRIRSSEDTRRLEVAAPSAQVHRGVRRIC